MVGHDGAVVALVVAADGSVWSGSWDHTVRGWCGKTGALLATLTGHSGSVFRLRFAPDGRLFSGSEDATIQVWSIGAGVADHRRHLRTYRGHGGAVKGLAVAADGTALYSASWDRSIRRWDASADGGDYGTALDVVHTGSPVVSLAFRAATRELLSGSVDGGIRVWTHRLAPVRIFKPLSSGAVDALVISLDGRVFSGCEDGTINVWSPADGTLLCQVRGHEDTVVDLAVSPKSNKLVSGSWDHTASLW